MRTLVPARLRVLTSRLAYLTAPFLAVVFVIVDGKRW